jgi:hypothetical protein
MKKITIVAITCSVIMGGVTELSQCTDLKEALDVNNAYNSCLTNLSNANIELNKIPTILKQPYVLPSFIINLDKVKFNSKILHKSGNLWKYSNGSNYNPCSSGWSVDYSGLKCSKSATNYSNSGRSSANDAWLTWIDAKENHIRFHHWQVMGAYVNVKTGGSSWTSSYGNFGFNVSSSGVLKPYHPHHGWGVGISIYSKNEVCTSLPQHNVKICIKDGQIKLNSGSWRRFLPVTTTETKNFNKI